jgi:UDP-GlcNAc:undecaprenyl-phosphate/decaprenyl-phosphate GlcNAc-1-phosphate transferase
VSGGTLVLLAGFLSAAITLVLVFRLRHLRAPRAVNYRGEALPVVLGLALTAGLTVAIVVATLVDAGQYRLFPSSRAGLEILASILLVFAGGLVDDLQPSRVHGLVRHFRELFQGRVTSGIVKLAVTVVAAAVFGVATRQHGLRLALCIPLVAGAANLWNLLDVAPGRAIKWFLPAGGVALALRPTYGFAPFEAAALGGALIALPFDLAEVAMLGDSGAYVLGFVAGAGLCLRLSTVGAAIALAVIVALHVLAETVTFTSLIRAAPPLRWLDDLGRLPEQDLRPESSSSA